MRAWRFLDSGPGPGPRQMAVDEALLASVAGGAPPVLRVFAFHPPCLSLGRFQPALRNIDPEACRQHAVDVVRRPTGGRAVLHAGDLCYAVVAPLDDPAVGGAIRDSYCRIALPLALALEMVGAPQVSRVAAREPRASNHQPPSPSKPALSAAEGGEGKGEGDSSCFALSGPFEMAVDGAKLIGSAQVRRGPDLSVRPRRGLGVVPTCRGGRALLQQGSVRLAADPDLESHLLRAPAPAASLRRVLGRDLPYAEMAAALRQAFAEALGLCLQDADLTEDDLALARRLERDKYANPRWTWER